MEKRGISAIIATVLIILITVVAVGIIWMVVIPLIAEADFSGANSARLSIPTQGGYTFYDPDTRILHVQVKRGADTEDIIGVEFLVSVKGNSIKFPDEGEKLDAPGPNEAKLYYLDLSGYIEEGDLETIPDSVTVVPIFNANGVLTLGDATSSDVRSETSSVIVPNGDVVDPVGGGSCIAGETAYVLAGSGVTSSLYPASYTWDNPNNIAGSGHATVFLPIHNNASADLHASNFGFSIPSDAVINGIEVEIKASGSINEDCQGAGISLVDKNGEIGTLGTLGDYWPDYDHVDYQDGDDIFFYGGSSDLWGATLSPWEVEDTDFGFYLRVENDDFSDSLECYVYDVKMKIYYETC